MNKNSGAIDRDEVTALIEMLNEQDSKFVDNIRGAQEQILGDGMHMTSKFGAFSTWIFCFLNAGSCAELEELKWKKLRRPLVHF